MKADAEILHSCQNFANMQPGVYIIQVKAALDKKTVRVEERPQLRLLKGGRLLSVVVKLGQKSIS